MSGKYQPYPEYRDSGVEWLGKIPKHWMSTELKRYSSVQGGYAFSSDSFIDSGKAVIRIGDIKQDGSVSLDSCKHIKSEDAAQHGQYEVRNGDLLMAMTGATIGKAGWFKESETALLNQRVGSFKCNKSHLNYRFFWYVLNSSGYQEYIKLTAFGGAQPNISDAAMVGYQSAFPLEEEQEKIANFLDHETAKIDTLIEKQQQLIKLLKEKRQAVISHAVTKGLNPNAPMRDSGIEWLGEVPTHWNITRLGWITSEINDINHEMPAAVDEGVPFLSAKDLLNNGTLNFTHEIKKISEEDFIKLSAKIRPRKNDIIYSRIGAALGKARLVKTDIRFLVSYSCCVIRLLEPQANPLYISLLLDTDLVLTEAKGRTVGIGVPDLGLKEISRFPIPLPPKDEQIMIENFLIEKTAKFTNLLENCQDGIKLLQERRTALISAAVTGKIDVRGWQAPFIEGVA